MKKAFTLIELLVVISIIGLLATVVLVSIKGFQDKARISKVLEFSQSIQHGLGAYAAGIWSFDEGSGVSALDGSGYGNNGVITGASYTSTTPQSVVGLGNGKYALHFNGISDFVNAGDPVSGILDFGTEDFTIEAWFYLDALPGAWKCIVNKGASGNVGYGMEINNFNRLTVSIQATGGTDQHVNSVSSVVDALKWYHAVAVFDRDNQIYAYLNGKIVASSAYLAGNNNSIDNAENFNIGKHLGNTRYFNGSLDEVRVYRKALTFSEIQQHYAEGLKKIQELALKQP